MKKAVFLVAFLFAVQITFAQLFSFGIKGGLNSTSLKFDEFSASMDDNGVPTNVKIKPKQSEFGYHFGVLARIKIASVYIQPEVLFSSVGSTINISNPTNPSFSENATIKYYKMDVPIMVGMKFGPARLNLGPVLSFNLGSSVKDAAAEVKDIAKESTSVSKTATIGAQVGAGIDILKKVTLDVRYEFGLSKLTDNVTVGGQSFATDQRQNQFLVSIGYLF